LKHGDAMLQATNKGERGFTRYVGWSIISKNRLSIARHKARSGNKPRRSKPHASASEI
jgi:hypothetical protein